MVTPASEALLREQCTKKMSYNVCLYEQDSPILDDKVLSGEVEKSSWGHHLLQTQIWSPVPFPPSRALCMPAEGQSCVNRFGCSGPQKGPLFIKGHGGHSQGPQEQQHPSCCMACPLAPKGYPLPSV